MTSVVKSYAAHNEKDPLVPHDITRRDILPRDVKIEILYCGVCHSDIHQVRDERWRWNYPLVPWHEMVWRVIEMWAETTKYTIWDLVGVWCLVDSCRTCTSCASWLETYCLDWFTGTYNAPDKVSGGRTYGWYSKQIVVTEDFVHKVSEDLDITWVAPLLCAGITTYSPLKYWGVWAGHNVWIVWLGGLWHMAVKFASSFGAEVTILSSSPEKEIDAKELWADHFVLTTHEENLADLTKSFDFIIDTVSAEHDYNLYLQMLKIDGTLICLWAPPAPAQINVFNLIWGRRKIWWSLIGGLAETQEMLDYCAEHNITSDVEIIDISYVNEAYERILNGDVKYRFVIDMSTL